MNDKQPMTRTTTVSDADLKASKAASSQSDQPLLVLSVGAEHETSLAAAISVVLQTGDLDSKTYRFLMSPPAAHLLAKQLRLAVKDYLRHTPDRKPDSDQ